jgi:hypothetical protein
MNIEKHPTLADIDLHSSRRVSFHRYVRNDAPTPEGWTDDGPCPGHHGNWSRMAMQQTDMDAVNSPAHYKQGAVEVIDIIEQIVAGYPPEIGYHIGNVLKYVARGPHKGNMLQDLAKGEFYLRRAINKSVKPPTSNAPRGRFTDDPGP